VARMRGESGKSLSARNHHRAAASMGGFRYLVPALRFLERPAQLGYAAASLPLGTELPTLICKNAQMRGRFRAKRLKATR